MNLLFSEENQGKRSKYLGLISLKNKYGSEYVPSLQKENLFLYMTQDLHKIIKYRLLCSPLCSIEPDDNTG